MDTKQNINKRLIKEIRKIDCKQSIKDFLEELLIEENSSIIGYAYKETYKKLINKYVDKKERQ